MSLGLHGVGPCPGWQGWPRRADATPSRKLPSEVADRIDGTEACSPPSAHHPSSEAIVRMGGGRMADSASASAALAGASEMSSGGGGGGHAVRVANGDCAPKEPDESCLARSEERRPWKERSRLSA